MVKSLIALAFIIPAKRVCVCVCFATISYRFPSSSFSSRYFFCTTENVSVLCVCVCVLLIVSFARVVCSINRFQANYVRRELLNNIWRG